MSVIGMYSFGIIENVIHISIHYQFSCSAVDHNSLSRRMCWYQCSSALFMLYLGMHQISYIATFMVHKKASEKEKLSLPGPGIAQLLGLTTHGN